MKEKNRKVYREAFETMLCTNSCILPMKFCGSGGNVEDRAAKAK